MLLARGGKGVSLHFLLDTITSVSSSFFPFGSESSMELSLSGTKVPGIFRPRERKFHGTFVPGSECSIEFSLPGAKVP